MGRMIRHLGYLLVILTVCAMGVMPAMAQAEPDLQPTGIGVTTLYAGVSNTVVVTVANSSNISVASFNVTLEADGVTIDTLTGSILGNADPSYWPAIFNFNWTPPASGNVTLTAIVDPGNNVIESNDANNQLQRMLNILDLSPVTVKVRVEGQNNTIWSGEVTFITSNITDKQSDNYTVDHPTALGALDAAAKEGGFGYVVSSAWGPLSFVEEVAGEANIGWDGWQYRVNWVSQDVAAVDYSVGNGDEVIWYYGSWMSQPLKLSVDRTTLPPTDNLSATVEASDGFSWSPVSSATVYVDGQEFTTDADGEAKDISLSTGNYTVYADKGTYAEYTRSNRVTVTVTEAMPDLIISDKYEIWEEGAEGTDYRVYFKVKNVGGVQAPAGHDVSLNIDGTTILEQIQVPIALAPNESWSANFASVITLGGETDTVLIRADVNEEVNELSEVNNYLSNTCPAYVSINAPISVPEGYDFTVPVNISNVMDFDACNYNVTYDPAVLMVDNVTDGEIDGTSIPVDFANEASRGTWTIVQNLPGISGVSGSGYLARLHFHVIGSTGDNTTISLSNGTLSSVMASPIMAAWSGDFIEISVLAGDVNGDGNVNACDITKVERIIAGLDPSTLGADANQDGNINAADITKVERIIAGLD